jgi:hypothetical protein
MTLFTKRPHEEIFRYHEFRRSDGRGWLNDEEALAECTVTAAEKKTGTDVTSAMISLAAVYNDTAVRYLVAGGASGTSYVITIRAVTSNAQKFDDRVECMVL